MCRMLFWTCKWMFRSKDYLPSTFFFTRKSMCLKTFLLLVIAADTIFASTATYITVASNKPFHQLLIWSKATYNTTLYSTVRDVIFPDVCSPVTINLSFHRRIKLSNHYLHNITSYCDSAFELCTRLQMQLWFWLWKVASLNIIDKKKWILSHRKADEKIGNRVLNIGLNIWKVDSAKTK